MSSIRNYGTSAILLRALLLILSFSFFIGCSTNTSGPVAPIGMDAGLELSAAESGRRVLWGYFSGYANPEDGVFEITPMRVADTHLNLVSILNGTAGVGFQVIWGDSSPSQGLFKVRVTLHHPYSYDPVFAGFDVRGILITGASQYIGQGLWTAGGTEPMLLNADGWTRWWNPLEFMHKGLFGYTDGILGSPDTGAYDAKLNAYKLYADALAEDENDLAVLTLPGLNDDGGRGVFRSAQLSRIYSIKLPAGGSYFNYAVDASWAPPSKNPPEVPDDFPPGANSQEAWYVRCDVLQNSLTYDPDTGDKEGNLMLYISVYDWQGRMNGALSPEVAAVNIHSYDLFGSSIGHASLIYEDDILALYYADLTPLCNHHKLGTHWLGVEVVSSKGKYKQSWQSAPSAALAAYYILPVGVSQGGVAADLTKLFGIHAWVLCESDGSSPALSDTKLNSIIEWTNAFWNRYGFGFELAQKTYINSSTYYNLSQYEHHNLYLMYHDITGLVNVYFVKKIVGMGAAAFAIIPCEFEECWGKETYVVYGVVNSQGMDRVLAHELGHNIGMLQDEYWLDWYSCAYVDLAFCGYTPTDIFCQSSDAVWGNLMYWSISSNSPNDYFVSSNDIEMHTPTINSQAENVVYFHTHYPNRFKDLK